MGGKKNRNLTIYVLICLFIIISYVRFQLRKRVPEPLDYEIPKPDPGREVYIYDLYTDKWVYKDQWTTRAPAMRDSKPSKKDDYITEEELEDYLEEHIDDFKEDNYWGTDFDLNDKADKK